MSTIVFEKEIESLSARNYLIQSLRAALYAAESGQDEVTIESLGMEITWNFADSEFCVIS